MGLIQGLTEFLPVSSSGHLELGKAIFGAGKVPEESLLFSVLVHAATALSTIIVFRKDILEITAGLLEFRWNDETRYAALILASMVPVGIVGLAFEEDVEQLFSGRVGLVGAMLFVTGLLLLFTQYAPPQRSKVNLPKAIVIGLAQAMAILPGISRSGATISTALLLGVEREKAARFSFLMVLVPILGATALKLKDYFEAPALSTTMPPMVLMLAFASAFLSGLFACSWMIKLVKKGGLKWFAIYCFIVGAIALAVTFLG